jgi:hypothetical protein
VTEVIASALVYSGLAAVLAGVVNLAWRLRVLHVHSRGQAALIVGFGLLLVVAGIALPPRTHRAQAGTQLDRFVPEWEFDERHVIRVHAPADRVYRALRQVTADEILFFRTLVRIRHPRRLPHEENILAPSPDRPLLDVALGSTFIALADTPGDEIAVATLVCCGRRRPGDLHQAFAPGPEPPRLGKAAMNFLMEDEGGGWTRLTTETRVHGTDRWTQRRFAAYWRVIYPGSALIRRMWLRAIKARAERGA